MYAAFTIPVHGQTSAQIEISCTGSDILCAFSYLSLQLRHWCSFFAQHKSVDNAAGAKFVKADAKVHQICNSHIS